jgi:hypothetical protein
MNLRKKRSKMRKFLIIFIAGWFTTMLRHFMILPVIDWQEHEITGIEFRIKI